MSLHWTLIAGFLYAEIVAVLLLLVPLVSARTWNKLFKSRFLKSLEHQLIYYFYILVAILVLFFLDAIREMRKYGDEQHDNEHAHGTHLDTQMQIQMRMFRAQRNFYISGFALFLSLVVRRLVSLISSNAVLDAEKEAALKQAQSASRAAESLAKTSTETSTSESDKKVKQLEEDLRKSKKDLEAMKNQAESVSTEYDRLLAEKDKLELKLKVAGVEASGDKKDD